MAKQSNPVSALDFTILLQPEICQLLNLPSGASLGDLNKQVESNNVKIDGLSKTIDEKKALIAEQQKTIDAKDALIAEQQKTIDAKDALIAEQQKNINELTNNYEALQSNFNELKLDYDALRNKDIDKGIDITSEEEREGIIKKHAKDVKEIFNKNPDLIMLYLVDDANGSCFESIDDVNIYKKSRPDLKVVEVTPNTLNK